MTTRKIDWTLTPAERELLKRDCEASGVSVAVEHPDAIKRVIVLITKAGDRRDAAKSDPGPRQEAPERSPPG